MKLKQILREHGLKIGTPVLARGRLQRKKRWVGDTLHIEQTVIPLRRVEKGVVVGATRLYSGRVETIEYNPLEPYQERAWIIDGMVFAIKVATGWLNKPLLVPPNLLERLEEPFDLPIQHCHWNPTELANRRKYAREDAKYIPRDEKGRFCREG